MALYCLSHEVVSLICNFQGTIGTYFNSFLGQSQMSIQFPWFDGPLTGMPSHTAIAPSHIERHQSSLCQVTEVDFSLSSAHFIETLAHFKESLFLCPKFNDCMSSLCFLTGNSPCCVLRPRVSHSFVVGWLPKQIHGITGQNTIRQKTHINYW